MKKFIKWLLISLTAALLLLVAAVTFVIFAIDPNSYKPQLAKLAAEQNVELNIKGELSWKIFPNLAIRIGETHIADQQGRFPTTSFRSADLQLNLLALLRRQIAVRAIALDGADITLQNLAQGGAAAAAPAAGATNSAEQDAPNGFNLAIASVELSDSRITLPGEPLTTMENVNLRSQRFNLDNKPFPLSLSFDLQQDESPTQHIVLETRISAADNGALVQIDTTNLTLSAADRPDIKSSFSALYNRTEDSLNLTDFVARADAIDISGVATLRALGTTPEISGRWQIKPFNLRKALPAWGIELPAPANSDALSRVALTMDIGGTADLVQLDNLHMDLDQTVITGSARFGLGDKRSLKLTLAGDAINVDDYAPASTKTSENDAPVAALFGPLAASVAWLNGGKGDVDIRWQSFTTGKMTLTDLHTAMTVRGKKVALSNFSTRVFGGEVKAKIGIDMAPAQPTITFEKHISGISIPQMTAAFDQDVDFQGLLDMSVSGSSRGENADQLQANLVGSGTLRVAQPALAKINVERSFCEVVALVEKTESTQTWGEGTQLKDIDSSFTLKGYDLVLDSYSTGVGNLTLRGNGVIDTQKEKFNLLVVSRLNGERTSETGCVVNNTRIRDRDIPLRCKDSFAAAGAKSCRPDGDIVKELLHSRLLEEVQKKTGMDQESSEALEGLLKGIFGKKK